MTLFQHTWLTTNEEFFFKKFCKKNDLKVNSVFRTVFNDAKRFLNKQFSLEGKSTKEISRSRL